MMSTRQPVTIVDNDNQPVHTGDDWGFKIVLLVLIISTFVWQYQYPCTSLPVLRIKVSPTPLYDGAWLLLLSLTVLFFVIDIGMRYGAKKPSGSLYWATNICAILLILLQIFYCGAS